MGNGRRCRGTFENQASLAIIVGSIQKEERQRTTTTTTTIGIFSFLDGHVDEFRGGSERSIPPAVFDIVTPVPFSLVHAPIPHAGDRGILLPFLRRSAGNRIAAERIAILLAADDRIGMEESKGDGRNDRWRRRARIRRGEGEGAIEEELPTHDRRHRRPIALPALPRVARDGSFLVRAVSVRCRRGRRNADRDYDDDIARRLAG
mmetsp:Transcript_11207/g.23861  ORF Transcript_11207/g.23861 Transcript_11207/m.23861 type:complete len:205 (+) Transcript_11207:151-765(+)